MLEHALRRWRDELDPRGDGFADAGTVAKCGGRMGLFDAVRAHVRGATRCMRPPPPLPPPHPTHTRISSGAHLK